MSAAMLPFRRLQSLRANGRSQKRDFRVSTWMSSEVISPLGGQYTGKVPLFLGLRRSGFASCEFWATSWYSTHC